MIEVFFTVLIYIFVIIPILFIVLAARIPMESLTRLEVPALAFVALLIFLVRPVAVYLSTLRTNLTVKERVFVAAIAPRGIVAAAVTEAAVRFLDREDWHAITEAPILVYLAPDRFATINDSRSFPFPAGWSR